MTTTYGVSNYGWCEGDWYVFGGPGAVSNRSAFGPNQSRRFAAFTDGLSQSLLAAEVKTYQQAYHDCTGAPFDGLGQPVRATRSNHGPRGRRSGRPGLQSDLGTYPLV